MADTPKHVKLSLSLSADIYTPIEQEAVAKNTDANSIIQRALADHASRNGYMDPAHATRLRNFWWLVDEAVATALRLCEQGGPSSDITMRACKACEANGQWMTIYASVIQGEPKGKGNPLKGPINREIGFRIRAALDAEVRKLPNGKPESVKVADSIIQSFTPFQRVFGEQVD